jgi:hypothetical protein
MAELMQQLDDLSFWLLQLLPHTPTGTIATTAPTTSLPSSTNMNTDTSANNNNNQNGNTNNNNNNNNGAVFPFVSHSIPPLTSPTINSNNSSFANPNSSSFSTTVTNMLLRQQEQQHASSIHSIAPPTPHPQPPPSPQLSATTSTSTSTSSTSRSSNPITTTQSNQIQSIQPFKPDYPARSNGFVARPGTQEWFLQCRELLVSVHHPIYRIQLLCLVIQHSIKQKVQQRVYVGLIFSCILIFFCLLRMTALGLFPVPPSSNPTSNSLQTAATTQSSLPALPSHFETTPPPDEQFYKGIE